MGILVRFRGTELRGGSLVHYPEATCYTVMQDNTVELRDGRRSIGAIHRDRWESLELVESAPDHEEPEPPAERRPA